MMTPFHIEWDKDRLAALRATLHAFDPPRAPEGAGWSLGADRAFLLRLRDHWADVYDPDAALTELNRYPQYLAEVDGLTIHLVHVKGEGTAPRPLLMTHGWPGSHYEFWSVVERLTRPSAFGGRTEDAFDLVLPTLPGYGYSGKPAQPIGPRGVAALWHRLMHDVLGYETYLAQGGDWGSVITSQMGLAGFEGLRAIHLNMAGLQSPEPPASEEELAWAGKAGAVYQRLGGYGQVQMMKPLSLGWLGTGNPMGQAAWIVERFHDWADLTDGDVETVFGLDHLVTNIMLYVMTESFSTSLWLYHGLIREGGTMLQPGQRCQVPTGYAAFPGDALMPALPRTRMERMYNLVHWGDPGAGGHFAAMEKPELFAADLLEWAAKAWPRS